MGALVLATETVLLSVNDTIWVANRGTHTIRGFDAATGEEVQTVAMAPRPSPDRLTMSGEMDGKTVVMRLELFPRERFLLVSRGFNWVQEYPFNR